jgi:alkylation response protein AidB-like acyl-CoA dehydrogenase
VQVPKTHLVPGYRGYDEPTADGAIFQIIQVAVDTGIAKAALDETVKFVRGKSRSWVDSGKDAAAEDPYTIHAVGQLAIKLHAAQALTERAGLAIDAAVATPTSESVAWAQVVTAQAKTLSTEVAIEASNKLFELAGTRSTLAEHHLDRHWRNARTHTLHDPVRWKYAIVGDYVLNGRTPPLHAWS